MGRNTNTPPQKSFYKIGEVAALLGIATHVLRYWETQFPSLRPDRTTSGQRHYRQKQIDEALRIQKLLHEDGFRIAAAQRLSPKRARGKTSTATPPSTVSATQQRALSRVIADLEKVLDDDEKAV